MKTLRFVIWTCLVGFVVSAGADDLPSRFNWRNVEGKCYVTPVRTGGETYSFAYAPMDYLESFYLIENKLDYNSLSAAEKESVLTKLPYEKATDAARRKGAFTYNAYGPTTYYEMPDLTKSLNWMLREGYNGRKLKDLIMVSPNEQLHTIKRNLMVYPIIAGYQHVPAYIKNNKYSYFPDYPLTSYYSPDYYRTVCIVGYDDSISKSYFSSEGQVPEGDGAWIAKGSYGTSFGEKGYFYISYYDQSLFHYENAIPWYVYDYIYMMQYDTERAYGKMFCHDIQGPSSFDMIDKDSYAVVFEADEDCVISAVGMLGLWDGKSIRIYAFTGCDEDSPASGKLVVDGDKIQFPHAPGYHIMDLPNPFNVKKGERFSIIADYVGGIGLMSVDKPVKGRYYRSYWDINGIDAMHFTDMFEDEENNACYIAAYTPNNSGIKVSMEKIDGVNLLAESTVGEEYFWNELNEAGVLDKTMNYQKGRKPEANEDNPLVKVGVKPDATELKLVVQSEGEWDAYPSVDWLSVKPSNGEVGICNVILSVAENMTGAIRIGNVEFKQGKNKRTIRIVQDRFRIYLSRTNSIQHYETSAENHMTWRGGRINDLWVTANGQWTAELDPEDKNSVVCTPSAGSPFLHIKELVEVGFIGEPKTLPVKFHNKTAEASLSIHISPPPHSQSVSEDHWLRANPSSISVSALGSPGICISIESCSRWWISSVPKWILSAKMADSVCMGYGSVILNIPANDGDFERTGTIVFMNEHGKTASVEVVQQTPPPPPDEATLTFWNDPLNMYIGDLYEYFYGHRYIDRYGFSINNMTNDIILTANEAIKVSLYTWVNLDRYRDDWSVLDGVVVRLTLDGVKTYDRTFSGAEWWNTYSSERYTPTYVTFEDEVFPMLQNLEPGTHTLTAEINATHIVKESNYEDNIRSIEFVIKDAVAGDDWQFPGVSDEPENPGDDTGGDNPDESEIPFASKFVRINEGGSKSILIAGGSEDSVSSVKVYLTHQTATAADVDFGKIKFPLTLTWEAGEIGEKSITISAKTDNAAENDEFFTLQLADAQGMELGEDTICKVTIHDPGYDELAAKIKAGAATKAEQSTWDKLQKAKVPYACVLADPANAGKVTGSGAYAAGKKVSMKATANKGYVFSGWGSPTGETFDITMNGQDARSPSASFTMMEEDVTLTALFATTTEDAKSLKIAVEDMTTEQDGTLSFDLGACVTSLSLPKVTVSGLPAGLKFDAKTNRIAGKATKPGVYAVTVKATNSSVTKATDAATATFMLTVPNFMCDALPGLLAANEAYGTVSAGVAFDAERIDCVPEDGWSVKVAGLPAGLKYDARSGKITGVPTAKPGAYTVTFTASKKGEKSQVATITLNVEALPDWAVGTFTGYALSGDYGLATMTVAVNGKISGKIQLGGTNWTFKADSYAGVECRPLDIGDGVETDYVIQTIATAGKSNRTLVLRVTNESCAAPGMTNAKVEGSMEYDMHTISLWRTIWKDKSTADLAKRTLSEWEGAYNVSFEPSEGSGYGSGYLLLAVGKDGSVKATGKLADGTSISAASPLMYDSEYGYFVLVYAAPSAYMGGSFALSISFDSPKGALGNSVEVSKWSSRNPQATGVYGEGFARWVSFFGSYYDKNASLTNFYDRLTFELSEMPSLVASCKRTYIDSSNRKVTETQPVDAAPVYLLDEDGLIVSVNAKGTGFDVLKVTKPVQDKGTKSWQYSGPNDGGLTLTFDQKTSIFKGTYTFWYDYASASDETLGKETWRHTSQKVSFEGCLVQGSIPRGFYLREESGAYEDQKTGKPKTYKYKSSHCINFMQLDYRLRRLRSSGNELNDGEWHASVTVRRGNTHTFWVDGLSPETSVSRINVEGSYTCLNGTEQYERLVRASEGGEMFDKNGNVVGLFVTLTTDDWAVDEYTPKYIFFRVEVDGSYDKTNPVNNKFKFHNVRGRFTFP